LTFLLFNFVFLFYITGHRKIFYLVVLYLIFASHPCFAVYWY